MEQESLSHRIRNNFLYGLFVILPIFATFWFVSLVIDVISGPLSSLLGQRIPTSISFLISLVLIFIIGITARNFFGRMILTFFEAVFEKTPLVNIVYRSTKQIINAFSFNKDKSLMRSVLVEYPRKGMWAIGFVTLDEVKGLTSEDGEDIGKDKIAIFLPTTPNPTSGYFVYVNKDDVVEMDLTVEESIKVLMSAGVVSPDGLKGNK